MSEASGSEGPAEEPFANLTGVGEHDSSSDEDDSALETMAVSDLPETTLVEARNDEQAIKRKLSEIALFASIDERLPYLPFQESLNVSLPLTQPLPKKLAIDDLEREKTFASITTKAVHYGLEVLHDLGIKFRRPPDYFAQMVKTDEHMGKVKKVILNKKDKIESAEKRRNNRDIVKNRKKVRHEQVEKDQQKKKKAREEIEAVSRVRNERLKKRAEKPNGQNDDDDDEFPIEMLDVEQLDENHKFQRHADVASGKKKAWRPSRDAAGSGKHGKGSQGEESFITRAQSGQHEKGERNDGKPQRRGNMKANGTIKKRGPKKRLGRSRRLAMKK